jgi:hypothetical protein
VIVMAVLLGIALVSVVAHVTAPLYLLALGIIAWVIWMPNAPEKRQAVGVG